MHLQYKYNFKGGYLMKKRFLLGAIIGCFMLGLLTLVLPGQQPEFSLDDNPSAPNNGPFMPPFLSAEDEFGLGLPLGGFIGGSPSLVPGGLFDSDILIPGPGLLLTFPPVPFYMDAFSADHSPLVPCGGGLFAGSQQ